MNHLYTIAHKRRLEARNDFDVGVILSRYTYTTRNGIRIKN